MLKIEDILAAARTLTDCDVTVLSDNQLITAYVDAQAAQRHIAHFLRNLSHERAIRAHKDTNA